MCGFSSLLHLQPVLFKWKFVSDFGFYAVTFLTQTRGFEPCNIFVFFSHHFEIKREIVYSIYSILMSSVFVKQAVEKIITKQVIATHIACLLVDVVGFIFAWEVRIQTTQKTITLGYWALGKRLQKDHEAQPKELSGRRVYNLSPDEASLFYYSQWRSQRKVSGGRGKTS